MKTITHYGRELIVLHWDAEHGRWERVVWDDFIRFRGLTEESRPLPGVNGGVHHFIVCVSGEGQIVNIIPHKYLVDPGGRLGADNFFGWTREERNEYSRLMTSTTETPPDSARLNELRQKAGPARYPPRSSLFALVQALPLPLARGSAAEAFLEEVLSLRR